jgi:hypothetical protein
MTQKVISVNIGADLNKLFEEAIEISNKNLSPLEARITKSSLIKDFVISFIKKNHKKAFK